MSPETQDSQCSSLPGGHVIGAGVGLVCEQESLTKVRQGAAGIMAKRLFGGYKVGQLMPRQILS